VISCMCSPKFTIDLSLVYGNKPQPTKLQTVFIESSSLLIAVVTTTVFVITERHSFYNFIISRYTVAVHSVYI